MLKTNNPIRPPRYHLTDFEKFGSGGQYFFDTARYYIYHYHNSYMIPSPYAGYPAKPFVEETLDNYAFYYGFQPNTVFNLHTKTPLENDIPAIWISGQKIRQIVDHIKGNVIEIVDSIENSISARSISKNAIIRQNEIFAKIDFAHDMADVIDSLGADDIRFSPAGDIDYRDDRAVRKAKERIRQRLEHIATVIARVLYFENNCREQFINDSLSQAIANLSATYIHVCDGKVVMQEIPPYYLICDFNSIGQYGENDSFAGFVMPCTYEQVMSEYGDATEMVAELEKIQQMNDGEFIRMTSAYNTFTNTQWWYNDRRTVSKAYVCWIAPRDTRYKMKQTQYGTKYIKKIDDEKSYPVHQNGKTVDSVMGYQMKGDYSAWMVHYAVIIGNRWLVDYGYEPYQVRTSSSRGKPMLPIQLYCSGKQAGYIRSIVSRLKANQMELDRLSYKIQELTANDLGRVFFIRGDKLNENVSVLNIVDDLKKFKITVIPPSGDEATDSISDIVRGEDMTNNQYIQAYIALKREQAAEMESIVSLPAIALGMQRTIVGKGVQEKTISQSTLAMMGFYDGLIEFYRRKLSYAANKYKMLLSEKPDRYVMPVSTRDVELIDITEDFRFEDLYVYFRVNDALDMETRTVFNQMLQAYIQNIQNPIAAEGLLNGIKLLRYSSLSEGIEQLEEYVEDLRKRTQKQFEQQKLIEQNQQHYAVQSQQILEQQRQMAELIKMMAQINLKGAWDVKKQEVKAGLSESRDEAIIDQALRQTGVIPSVQQPPPDEQTQQQTEQTQS